MRRGERSGERYRLENVESISVDGRESNYAPALSFMLLPSKNASERRIVASPDDRSVLTQATTAFNIGEASRPLSTSIAAATPPARCGTLARSRLISMPARAPINIRSF